ncbi:MAG TPA: Arc family DNA-binding protein [Burkholderiaceae bacterium]
MSTLVVKNLPDQLHERLKAQAQQHHRSITKEAIALIEQGLLAPRATASGAEASLPPLVRLPGGPLTAEWIEAAIADGRR